MDYHTLIENLEEALARCRDIFQGETLFEEMHNYVNATIAKISGDRNKRFANSLINANICSVFLYKDIQSFDNINEKNIFDLLWELSSSLKFVKNRLVIAGDNYLEIISNANQIFAIADKKTANPFENTFLTLYFIGFGWLMFILFQLSMGKIDSEFIDISKIDITQISKNLQALNEFSIQNKIWDRSIEDFNFAKLQNHPHFHSANEGNSYHYFLTDLKSVMENMCQIQNQLFRNSNQIHLFYTAYRGKIIAALTWLASKSKLLRNLEHLLPINIVNAVLCVSLSLFLDNLYLQKNKERAILNLTAIFGEILNICLIRLEDNHELHNELSLIIDIHNNFKKITPNNDKNIQIIDACVFIVMKMEIERLKTHFFKRPHSIKLKKLKESIVRLLINLPFDESFELFNTSLLQMLEFN
jgi:hypothetical protein